MKKEADITLYFKRKQVKKIQLRYNYNREAWNTIFPEKVDKIQFSSVDFSCSKLGDMHRALDKWFAEDRSALVSVKYHNCTFSENGQTLLEQFEKCPNVTSLIIQHCEIGFDKFLSRLANCENVKNLRELIVIGLTNSANIFKLLLNNHQLKIVPAWGYGYSSNDLFLTHHSMNFSSMVRVADDVVKALKYIDDFKEIQRLNFSGARLDKAAVVALKEYVESHASIKQIILDKCSSQGDISEPLTQLMNNSQLLLLSMKDVLIDLSLVALAYDGYVSRIKITDRNFSNAMSLKLSAKNLKCYGQVFTCKNKNFDDLFYNDSYRKITEQFFSALSICDSINTIRFNSVTFCKDSFVELLKSIKANKRITRLDLSMSYIKGDNIEDILVKFMCQLASFCALGLQKVRGISLENLYIKLCASDFSAVIKIDVSNDLYSNCFENLKNLNQYLLNPQKIVKVEFSRLDNNLESRLCRLVEKADNLECLNLSSNPKLNQIDQVIKAIVSHKNIRRLDLSGLALSDAHMLALKGRLVDDQCLLSKLTLKECQLSRAGFKYLCEALAYNKSLISLDVSFNPEIVDDLELLALSLNRNSTLTKFICLEQFRVGGGSVAARKKHLTKQVKPRIPLVGNFAYALNHGVKRSEHAKKKRRPNESKNKALLECVLFGKDFGSYATRDPERNALEDLSLILKFNSRLALGCFAELGREQPSAKKCMESFKNGRGMSPYVTDKEGDTVLHIAVRKKLYDVITAYFKAYRDWHIDLKFKNNAEETPLSLANGDDELIALLRNPDTTRIEKVENPRPKKRQKKEKKTKTKTKALVLQQNDKGEKRKRSISKVSRAHKKEKLDDVGVLQLDDLSPRELIEEGVEDRGRLYFLKQQLDQGAECVFEDCTLLHVSVRFRLLRVTKLLLRHGLDVNANNEKGQNPLTIAAALNCKPVFVLLLSDPRLTSESMRQVSDYCDQNSASNPFLKLYQPMLLSRLQQPFLPLQNIQWLKNMQVIYGSKHPGKQVLIPSAEIQMQLFMRNKYTLALLAKRVEDDEVSQAGGNPVTCAITFIVSTAQHSIYGNQARKAITVYCNMAKDQGFHVAINGEEDIQRQALREKISQRSQKGLNMLVNHPKFEEGAYEHIFQTPESILDEDQVKDATFPQLFHHGEQSLISALENPHMIQQICAALFQSPEFPWGAKVYGVVLDICSPRYVCSNCQLAILSAQSPKESVFLGLLADCLTQNDCKLPSLSHLKMITRVGSYKAFERAEPVTMAEHLEYSVDMRLSRNELILQRDIVETTEQMTQFHSSNPG